MYKTFTLPELFRAARLPRSGAWVPASAALIRARANGAAFEAAKARKAAACAPGAFDAAKAEAEAALAAANTRWLAACAAERGLDWQAPGFRAAVQEKRQAAEIMGQAQKAWAEHKSGRHAKAERRKAEAEWDRLRCLCYSSRKLGAAKAPGALGKAFESAGWTLRWHESPKSAFRFCGLSSDLIRLDHTGYYMDSDGMGESARGVVYQLAPRNGRARYIPAIADPFDSDKSGHGPAMLGLSYIQEAEDSSESAAEDARAEAARMADSMAEDYAEAERDYQDEYRQGQEAKEKAEAATVEGKAWVTAIRGLRGLWQGRHGLGKLGLDPDAARGLIRGHVAQARAACEAWQEARQAAAEARPYRLSRASDGFVNGYRDGGF